MHRNLRRTWWCLGSPWQPDVCLFYSECTLPTDLDCAVRDTILPSSGQRPYCTLTCSPKFSLVCLALDAYHHSLAEEDLKRLTARLRRRLQLICGRFTWTVIGWKECLVVDPRGSVLVVECYLIRLSLLLMFFNHLIYFHFNSLPAVPSQQYTDTKQPTPI